MTKTMEQLSFNQMLEPLQIKNLPEFVDCNGTAALQKSYTMMLGNVTNVLDEMEAADTKKEFDTALKKYEKYTNAISPRLSIDNTSSKPGYDILKTIDPNKTDFFAFRSVVPDDSDQETTINDYFNKYGIEDTDANKTALLGIYETIGLIEQRVKNLTNSFKIASTIKDRM